MSGADLAQHTQAAPAQPATVDTTEDYAASLRAAALMTLKSKRRKVNVSQAGPIPPQRTFAAPPSIELDYGQEEPTGTSSFASSPVMAPAKPAAPPPPVDEPMDIDPSPAREEGEISDSEEAPPSPKAKIEPQSPTLVKTESATQIIPPKMNLSPALPHPAALASVPTLELPHISAASALVDENHVRPGLALTQAQYDTAKDIVLDLLGWGVPPEYLVDCGLSREIVYYVFVELNLRLPSNLDTTGLPLPAPYLFSQPSHPSTSATRASLTHPSLPPKPQPDSTPALHALSASAAPFVPTTSDAASSSASDTPDSTLNDMEQQRRQELLARKAVLASRKAKRKAPPSHSVNTTTTAHQPVATGIVPPKAVDDFLQSIEPVALTVSDTPAATVASSFTQPASRPDANSMEVDDVPGLITAYDPTTEYTPLPRPRPGRPQPIKSALSPESATSQSPAVPNSAVSTVSDRSFNPPSSAASIGGTPRIGEIDDDMDAVPGLFRPRSLPDSEQPAPRRGTKRPVAADFVDMDSGPAQTTVKGTNPDFFRANIRRKTAGFAGLTQRRCIIDLSDSEDEDSIPRFNGVYSRIESRVTKPSTPQVTVAPTPRTHSPAVAPSVTPSALQKAEEEIRQLHEAIAQRRRKKKPVASSQPTPTPEMLTNGVSIKQEDDDSTGFGIRSFDPSRSTSSATPDPTANGRPNDSQDERSVLATLLPREPSQNGTVSLPDSASSSNAATPIEPTPQLLEHPTTGDKVLTHEALHEQVVTESKTQSRESTQVAVDVIGDHPETSTQVNSDSTKIENAVNEQMSEQASTFPSYHSLLDYHPLLREHSRQDSAPVPDKSTSDASQNGASASTSLHSSIDLDELKQSAVMKYLSSGSGRICQYEVPGGGECRDSNCEDVHLSRLPAVEPSGTSLSLLRQFANLYIAQPQSSCSLRVRVLNLALPPADEDTALFLCVSVPVGPRYGVKAFRDALDVARLRHPTMPFDARVEDALASLGLR